MTEIKRIEMKYINGMYSDVYTVTYKSGVTRRYDIRKNGCKMINKHFDFIINAKVRPIYNKWTGTHVFDVYEMA